MSYYTDLKEIVCVTNCIMCDEIIVVNSKKNENQSVSCQEDFKDYNDNDICEKCKTKEIIIDVLPAKIIPIKYKFIDLNLKDYQ